MGTRELWVHTDGDALDLGVRKLDGDVAEGEHAMEGLRDGLDLTR